jgi:hypothetical protein
MILQPAKKYLSGDERKDGSLLEELSSLHPVIAISLSF